MTRNEIDASSDETSDDAVVHDVESRETGQVGVWTKCKRVLVRFLEPSANC